MMRKVALVLLLAVLVSGCELKVSSTESAEDVGNLMARCKARMPWCHSMSIIVPMAPQDWPSCLCNDVSAQPEVPVNAEPADELAP